MSIHGSKRKEIPILSYELQGEISDDSGPVRWHNSHIFRTVVGTFTFSFGRRPRLSDLTDVKRYGHSLFVGSNSVDYERPDFTTYMTDDGEMLDRQIGRT